MAKTINQVILMGRLSQDPKVKPTTTGKTLAHLSLAVDKVSGDGTDFFNLTAWEKTAELAQQYLNKGSKVLIQGSLSIDSWEKDGQKFSRPNITVRDITFLDSKSDVAKKNVGTVFGGSAKDEEPVDLSSIPF